jgi:hypothetical protein
METKQGVFKIRVCKNGYLVMPDNSYSETVPVSTPLDGAYVFESWETLVHFLSSNMVQPDVNLFEEMVRVNRKTKLEEEIVEKKFEIADIWRRIYVCLSNLW